MSDIQDNEVTVPTGAAPAQRERPIEVGDRFMSKDTREAGRVVQVVQAAAPVRHEQDRTLTPRWKVVNDEMPTNTSAVGRHSTISEHRLRSSFRRLSR